MQLGGPRAQRPPHDPCRAASARSTVTDEDQPAPPSVGEPGLLEAAARKAGLAPAQSGEIDVPHEIPDEATFVRGLRAPAGVIREAIEHSGEEAVRAAALRAAAPFRQPDRSYRLHNRFTYLVGAA